MGPDWTHACRFPVGSRLRFTRTLAAPLRRAIEQESAGAAAWLAAVDGATLALEAVEPTRCVAHIDLAAGSADIECVPAGTATFDVHARLRHGTELYARSLGDVAIMLGGMTDVYLAERGMHGTRQLVRLRYESGTRAEVAVFTAPFASHLTRTVRALLPAIVVVGRLDVLNGEAVA